MLSRFAWVSVSFLLGGLLLLAVPLRGDVGFFVYELADDNVFESGRAYQSADGRFIATYAFDLAEGETFEVSADPLPGDDTNPASLEDHLRLYLAKDGGGWEKADTLAASSYSEKSEKLRFLFTTDKPGQTVRFRVNFRLQTLGDARPVRVCNTQRGEFTAGNVLIIRFDDPVPGSTYHFVARCQETSLKLYAGRLEEGLVVMTARDSVWAIQDPDAAAVALSFQSPDRKPFGLRISPENQQVGGKVQLDTEIALPLKLTYDPRNPKE